VFARSHSWSIWSSLARSSLPRTPEGALRLASLGLALWLCTPAARAQTQAVVSGPRVSWTAPEGCPDTRVIEQRIAALLGAPPATGDARALVQATGVITHGRGGFNLTLSVKGPDASGTRKLAGADCTALSETAAWLVAVTIDADAPSTPPPPPEPTPKPPEPAPTPPPVPPKKRLAPPSAPVPRWSVHGGALGGVSSLHLPNPQVQLGGSLGAGFDFVLAELRFGKALDDEVTAGQGDAHSNTQSYALAVCTLWGKRFRVGPCASIALMRTHAESRRVPIPEEATARWANASLGAHASAQLISHLDLFVEGGMQGPVSQRPEFTLRPDDITVIGPAQLGWYAHVGVRVRWLISRRGLQ
jgi:hypothetical protein